MKEKRKNESEKIISTLKREEFMKQIDDEFNSVIWINSKTGEHRTVRIPGWGRTIWLPVLRVDERSGLMTLSQRVVESETLPWTEKFYSDWNSRGKERRLNKIIKTVTAKRSISKERIKKLAKKGLSAEQILALDI